MTRRGRGSDEASNTQCGDHTHRSFCAALSVHSCSTLSAPLPMLLSVRALLLLAVAASACLSVDAATIDWVASPVTPSWSGRAGSAAATCGLSLYMSGGSDGVLKNDVHRLDLGATSWAQDTSAAPWPRRYNHALVQISPFQMILMGGQVDEGYGPSSNNDVWLADCSPSSAIGLRWSRLQDADWSGRYYFRALLFLGRLWVLGGTDWQSLNDQWSLPLGGSDLYRSWCNEGNAEWSARTAFGAAVFNNSMYVIGGDVAGSGLQNDVWRKSSLLGPWERLADASCSPRFSAGVGLGVGRIVMGGGSTGGSSLTDSCSFDGVSWESDNAPTWAADGGDVSAPQIPTFQSRMWWFAGITPAGSFRNNVYSALGENITVSEQSSVVACTLFSSSAPAASSSAAAVSSSASNVASSSSSASNPESSSTGPAGCQFPECAAHASATVGWRHWTGIAIIAMSIAVI